jgi:imidazolonepropionase-like amidohydrolase
LRPGSRSFATWATTATTRTRRCRQAIEQGWIPGPTVINSGIIIGGMGGQFFPTPEMAKDHNIVYPEYLDADTPDEIVKAIRQNVLFGAKVIKICVDCKPYGYTADEIRLIIRESAKSGMKVEGHVQTLAGAKNAIDAGIWSIAHSTALNDEMHKLMAQKGIWRAGTETPQGLAGHPVTDQAYRRTVDGLKNAYDNKVPLTSRRTLITGWKARRAARCAWSFSRPGRTPAFRTPTFCAQ